MLPPPIKRISLLFLGGVVGFLLLVATFYFFAPQREAAVVKAPPAPVPARVATPAPPPLDATSAVILELFNPSDQSLTHQLNETNLSQQIEQMLVTTYVLTQCGIITKEDYRDIFQALILYAAHMKLAPDAASAEAKVRQIAESSSASYSLVYSRTKCDDPSLPGIAEKLLAWQRAYLPKQP